MWAALNKKKKYQLEFWDAIRTKLVYTCTTYSSRKSSNLKICLKKQWSFMYRGKRQKSSDKNVLSSGSKSSSDRSKRKSDEKRRSCLSLKQKLQVMLCEQKDRPHTSGEKNLSFKSLQLYNRNCRHQNRLHREQTYEVSEKLPKLILKDHRFWNQKSRIVAKRPKDLQRKRHIKRR